MLPRGHGTLMLQSRDPAVQPRIELNYCSDPEDERRLMDGVRLAWTVLRAETMANAYQRIAGLSEKIVGPGQELRRYIRPNIGPYSHASGTAPIRPRRSANAVLAQRSH